MLKDLRIVLTTPYFFVCAVFFSRLWALTRPRLNPRFARPSESQRSRNRFCGRNAPKQRTQNTVAKKRAPQEDVDSDSLFDDFLQRRVGLCLHAVSLGISKQVSAAALRHPGASHIPPQHPADTERLYGNACRDVASRLMKLRWRDRCRQ